MWVVVVVVSGGSSGHVWLWDLAQAWWLLAGLLALVQAGRHWSQPVTERSAEAEAGGRRGSREKPRRRLDLLLLHGAWQSCHAGAELEPKGDSGVKR